VSFISRQGNVGQPVDPAREARQKTYSQTLSRWVPVTGYLQAEPQGQVQVGSVNRALLGFERIHYPCAMWLDCWAIDVNLYLYNGTSLCYLCIQHQEYTDILRLNIGLPPAFRKKRWIGSLC
jgi:hypothetical protein